MSDTITSFQMKLSRFLDFEDILKETKSYKERLNKTIKDKQDVNYT